MALRWFDGMEQYGTLARMTEGVGGGAAWSEVNAGWTLSTANPATQAYHLHLNEASVKPNLIRRIFGVSSQVVGFGHRFNIAALPASETEGYLRLAAFRDVANATQFMLILGTDGSVCFTNNAGTIITRSEPCVSAGGYHHFEAKVKVDNSVGYVEVRINEVTVLNLTGIDTQATANAHAAQVAVGVGGSVLTGDGGFSSCDFDDFFAWDDDASDPENTIVDFIGDKGVYYQPPIADTATSEFDINGSATAYGAIDEVPPNGTDYLDTAGTAARTIVEVQDLPGNVSEVIAWMPVIYPRKEESGSVTMRGGVVVGTDESYGPDDSPSTEYAYLRPSPKTINPETGVAWANDEKPNLLIERTA